MTATHRDRFGRTINREHSPLLAQGVPLLTILLGSLTPLLPIMAAGPVVPPFGFMVLLAWRIQRPGVLPMWIGLPLGTFDDLFSGQPFGSAIMLWSLALLALEAIETRFPWRGFWQDWLTAAGLIAAYLVIGAIVAGGQIDFWRVPLVAPQILLGILLFPLVARMVAFFDRVRLIRIRHVD
ncbi:MAG: rod shape-determining protein MreD [Candidatus Andeanibacterium colombiense]|uniref:Rod shape-determining protein MreD n=1 Tax=Candidatus Andeanibacterium colombiense TaxID=3121345 RepID=A0AAJ6BQ34_9SPHN|nr:MAG: rod shape-determining protein MreD [Sphingomonadaceae bacterium]